MKNVLILYNVIFLLIGNVLFANIHYLTHHHDHSHDHSYNYTKCEECVIIKDSNKFIIDNVKVTFPNKDISVFAPKYYSLLELNIEQTYKSRAPPIS